MPLLYKNVDPMLYHMTYPIFATVFHGISHVKKNGIPRFESSSSILIDTIFRYTFYISLMVA
jgi:hypothetical protein